jgi:hypothetical protein
MSAAPPPQSKPTPPPATRPSPPPPARPSSPSPAPAGSSGKSFTPTGGVRSKFQRTVIYGPGGVGKSSLAEALKQVGIRPLVLDIGSSTAFLDVERIGEAEGCGPGTTCGRPCTTRRCGGTTGPWCSTT